MAMMDGEKKKPGLAALLMSRGDSPMDEEPEGDEGMTAAAEEVMAAIKSGDARALAAALRSAFDIMGSADVE